MEYKLAQRFLWNKSKQEQVSCYLGTVLGLGLVALACLASARIPDMFICESCQD